MTKSNDDYLWDRSGTPDADVVRLERLLAPLAHRESAPAPTAATRGLRALGWIPFSIAAGLVVAISGWALLAPSGGHGRDTLSPSLIDDGPVVRLATGDEHAAGTWVSAEATAREIEMKDVGKVTVHPGSRVQVRRLADDVTRLYLERGKIEARIGADVRPRFFQVDTDAARCVDLGCRYELTAEPDGSSKVSVLTGRVSFETATANHETREVYVPARGVCFARKGKGPGTPRFEDAPIGLAVEVDRFDAAADAGVRRDHAQRAAALAQTNDDLLPVWHWLTDPDADVARIALARLREKVGDPKDWTAPAGRPGLADRQAFRSPLGLNR